MGHIALKEEETKILKCYFRDHSILEQINLFIAVFENRLISLHFPVFRIMQMFELPTEMRMSYEQPEVWKYRQTMCEANWCKNIKVEILMYVSRLNKISLVWVTKLSNEIIWMAGLFRKEIDSQFIKYKLYRGNFPRE